MINLEDTALTSNFHAFSKRCVIAASSGPQCNVALSAYNVIYVFKLSQGRLELRAKLQCECEPQIAISTRRRKATAALEPSPGDSTQVAMQRLATLHNVPRFVHVSWTPKLQLADESIVNLLCTISITNRIELWHLPNTSPPGQILYIENVLNIGSLILKQCSDSRLPIYPKKNDFKNTLPKRLMRCICDATFPVAHFLETPNDAYKSLIGVFSIGDFVTLVRIASKDAEDDRQETRLLQEGGDDDDEEDEVPGATQSLNEQRYMQGQDPLLDLKGARILNDRERSDLFTFDYRQCRSLFPIETNKSEVSQLVGTLLGIANLGHCCSIVGVGVGSSILIYASKLDCSVELIRATITYDLSNNPRLVWGVVTLVTRLECPLEMMRHYTLGSVDVIIGIALGSIHVIKVDDADAGATDTINVSNVPLVSYSLKTRYECEESTLAEITAVDHGGRVYRVLLDSNIKLVQVPGEIERSCGLVAQCDAGPSLYSCKTWTNQIAIQHVPIHASLFVSVLAALGHDATWRFDFIRQHINHFKTQKLSTNGYIDVIQAETIPLEHENMQRQADQLINTAKFKLLVDMQKHLKARHQKQVSSALALGVYTIACIEATRQTDAIRQLALCQIKINCLALSKYMYSQLDKLVNASQADQALQEIILEWMR